MTLAIAGAVIGCHNHHEARKSVTQATGQYVAPEVKRLNSSQKYTLGAIDAILAVALVAIGALMLSGTLPGGMLGVIPTVGGALILGGNIAYFATQCCKKNKQEHPTDGSDEGSELRKTSSQEGNPPHQMAGRGSGDGRGSRLSSGLPSGAADLTGSRTSSAT